MADCEKALIVDNYRQSSIIQTDYRLSALLNESVYEQVKRDAGGEAVLFGVPVGGEYADFSERVRELASRREEQFSNVEAVSIAWSGLSANALNAYAACLSHGMGQGLRIAVQEANEHQVVLAVHWKKGIGGPQSIALEWDAPDDIAPLLPDTASDAPAPIKFVVPRPPSGNHFLAVRGIVEGEAVLSDSLMVSSYAPLTPEVREKQWRMGWSTDRNVPRLNYDCIVGRVPLSMIGRNVTAVLASRSDGASTGSVSAAGFIDGNQVFVTPHYEAHDNPMLPNVPVSFDVPITAREILIKISDRGAVFQWATANFYY